jgi:Tol biopolymer transport system component
MTRLVVCALGACLVMALCAEAAEKMPATTAGDIGKPSGQIAFIRDKSIWTMDAFGGRQTKICEALNADGRLSWAPDGKRIAFTRSGQVSLQGPDNLGGKHKVYDIFVAYTDSAVTGNTFFWKRLSGDLGSRDPEWSADGRSVIYYKDMNANVVNAELPNYQICITDTIGTEVEILRKDWRNMAEFLKSPSMNASGDIVFEYYVMSAQGGQPGSGFRTLGIAVLNRNNIMVSLDSIARMAAKASGKVSPVWSPDGKWIAYVSNSMQDPGIFVTTPDLSKSYLVFTPPPGTSLNTMSPSFSPNSKWLTFATSDGSIWTCDITGATPTRLTGPGLDWAPTWSKTAASGRP